MAKYSFNVPGLFSEPALSTKDAPCGGLKDAPCAPPSAKVTLYGGYQHVDQSNPEHNQSFYSGFTTIGGYRYVTNPSATLGFRRRESPRDGGGQASATWMVLAPCRAWFIYGQNSYLNATGTSGRAIPARRAE